MKINKNNLHLVGFDNSNFSKDTGFGKQILKAEEVFRKASRATQFSEAFKKKLSQAHWTKVCKSEGAENIFKKVSRFF